MLVEHRKALQVGVMAAGVAGPNLFLDLDLMISASATASIKENHTGKHRAHPCPGLGCAWSQGYAAFSSIRKMLWLFAFYYV